METERGRDIREFYFARSSQKKKRRIEGHKGEEIERGRRYEKREMSDVQL